MNPVQSGSSLSSSIDGLELGLRDRRGQVAADGRDADLGAVAVLAGDVPLRSGVVADEDGAEPRHDTLLAQHCDATCQFRFDLGGRGLAVKNLGSHAVPFSNAENRVLPVMRVR